MKIAYPLQLAASLDPARIDTAAQAVLLLNMYSPLVEHLPDGQLGPGVAKSFHWEGDELRFEIRAGLKTLDGVPIGANDAELSLKRLMILGRNTHGSLAHMICDAQRICKISDQCSGLRVEGDMLILKASDPCKHAFLLPLLAGPDFGIIPKDSIDLDSVELEIRDLKNTSGPFGLVREGGSGRWILEANPCGYHYSPGIPQRIDLVSSFGLESLQLLKSGDVDFVSTVSQIRLMDATDCAQNSSEFHVFKTLPIRLLMIHFLARARRELSADQRLGYGELIRQVYLASSLGQGLEPTRQFFPARGDGSLDSDVITQLDQQISAIIRHLPPLSRKIVLGVTALRFDAYKQILKNVPGIEVVQLPQSAWMLSEKEQPDCYITDNDLSFYEDISLISYNIEAETFGLDRTEGMTWLSHYMSTPSKVDRNEQMRNLHRGFLSKGIVIPIGMAPYVAVSRSPWKIDLSPYYAQTDFWRIHQG